MTRRNEYEGCDNSLTGEVGECSGEESAGEEQGDGEETP